MTYSPMYSRQRADFVAATEAAVQPLVDTAAAWAEGTLPGGAGTKSAKEHATDAAASAVDAANATGSHVIIFGETGEGNAVHGSGLATVSSRYAATVDGNGYLNIEYIAVAIERVGWIKQASGNKVGRTFTHVAEFPATNFSGTNGAAGFAFSDKFDNGAEADLGGSAVYLYVRSNGTAQLVDDAGAVVPGYTLTVGSVAVPTFTGGAVVTTTYKRNIDGTGTFTVQVGATVSTITVTPALPHAYVVPIIRSPIAGTGTPGSGSNYQAKMRSYRWDDATVTQEISEITQQQYVGSALTEALPKLGSPIAPAVDALALTPREIPAPFVGKLPILPVQVTGPGKVQLNRTAIEAFGSAYPTAITGNIAYVAATGGGAPGTAALNDPAKPYTLAYALRTLATANIIVALPGDYDPVDFRSTDAAGAMPKLLIAQQPGTCRFRVAATDTLSALTWTATGGYTGIYEAAYTGTYGGVGIHRLTRTDVLDRWGYPAQILRCASVAAVDAAAQGYYVDTAAKKVYVKLTGGIDVNASKAALRPFWMTSGGTSRHYQQGTTLALSGWVIDGLEIALNIGASIRPILYVDMCEQRYSFNYGVNDFGGAGEAYFFATRWRCHAAAADGVNLGAAGGLTGTSITNIGDFWISDTGAPSGLGVGTSNKQAISNHGGLIGAFGGLLEESNGQEIADTSLDGVTNASWYVGCLARRYTALSGSVGFGGYGTGSAGSVNRAMWIDTCSVAGPFDYPLRLENYASAKVLNNTGLTASTAGGSVAPTTYTADAP